MLLDYFVGIISLEKNIAGHIAGTTLHSEFALIVCLIKTDFHMRWMCLIPSGRHDEYKIITEFSLK